jgi:hypothetical protein
VDVDKHNLVFEEGQLMLGPKVKATKINSIEIWTDRCLHCVLSLYIILKYFFFFKFCDTLNEISSLALGID